jgi:hypothetical protein
MWKDIVMTCSSMYLEELRKTMKNLRIVIAVAKM